MMINSFENWPLFCQSENHLRYIFFVPSDGKLSQTFFCLRENEAESFVHINGVKLSLATCLFPLSLPDLVCWIYSSLLAT